tara:strand:+ start:193 stop:948 length:756 start_codon:yes stop_codon:yes gene_type:complete
VKKILITSDKYSFCLDGFQELLSRHWKEEDIEFTVLGFAEPKATLRKNFKFQSFGQEYNDASPWVDALMTYFPELEDDYFFLCFEDHYLIGDVNLELLNHAERIMQQDKEIGKVRLLPHYQCDNKLAGEYDEHFNFYLGRENIVSTTSLRPSIWRRDYFIELLTNPSRIMNPGEFEDKNQALFLADTKMLIPKGDSPLYPDIDAFRKGSINAIPISGPGVIDEVEYKLYITQEDVDVFRSNIKIWENRHNE